MNIKPRRIGYTKEFMEQMEAYYKENPNGVIVGPNSPYTKFDKPTYDGSKIHRYNWDYDDPWYVPIEWIIANPEKYQVFLENKRKTIEAWEKAFNIKPINIKGKAIISTITDSDDDYFSKLWDKGEPSSTGLKRFFMPAYKQDIDEYGNENEQP